MHLVVRLLIAAAALLFAPSAHAQFNVQGWGFSSGGAAAQCGGYTGPGDLATFTVWVGLRAYSKATCGANAIQLTRLSDSATLNVATIGTTGKLDVASAATFAGTDATCSATASGTTLSVASCSSGTLHAGDQITGSGFTGVTIISAIGTCGSPPGTCTIDSSQSVGIAVTITASKAIVITTFYDTSGANFCGGSACNFTATASLADAYVLAFNCDGTLPCGRAVGKSIGSYASASETWPTQPNTEYSVGERLAGFTTFQYFFGVNVATNQAFGYINSANTVAFQCSGSGSQQTATAADSTLHFLLSVCNGASGSVNVDGTITSANMGTTSIGTNTLLLGAAFAGSALLNGEHNEFGLAASALSSTVQGNLHTQVSAFWGTP